MRKETTFRNIPYYVPSVIFYKLEIFMQMGLYQQRSVLVLRKVTTTLEGFSHSLSLLV